MRIEDPLFITTKHKYNLSTYEVWPIMEENVTFCARIKPDWDKFNCDEDIGVVIKNGKHAGIQLSKNQIGEGFIKAILWVTDEESGDYPVQVFNNIGKVPNDDWWDVAFRCDLEKKEISIMVKKSDWDTPHIETVEFSGKPVDYTEAWLWVACNNALEMTPDEDKGFYYGDIGKFGVFGKVLDKDEFVKFFNNDFVLEDWDKAIAVCNFDRRTPYKFWDESMNGNYLMLYQPEWGDLF
tara:strand:+ start:588 stop:1301 length:714 start_codon:yes stop_codon:yes gene_type:complete